MSLDEPSPDVRRIDLDAVEDGVFPEELQSEYRVVIQQGAFDTIETHAATDTSVELCGVLTGRLLKDEAGPFLLVEQAIPGEATRRTSSRVTFTHETWEQIHAEMETSCPELSIVGWYHTHPGFGVFLSEMDQFIQENFFNLPHQVAFVFDPLSGEQGLFAWEEGRSARLRRYWLGGKLRHDVDQGGEVLQEALHERDHHRVEPATDAVDLEAPGAGSRWGMVAWYVAAVAVIIAAFWLGGWTERARVEHSRQRLDAVDSLLSTGLLLEGLSDDLTCVVERLDRAHAELHSSDGAAESMDAVSEALKASHRDLVRMRRTYGEGERLVRALKQRLAPTPGPTSAAVGMGPEASPTPGGLGPGE